MPDTKPGFYYVSAVDGNKYALMLGPFKMHEEALQMVEQCRNKACDLNPHSHWWQWGTCREDDDGTGEFGLGKMNDLFNVMTSKKG